MSIAAARVRSRAGQLAAIALTAAVLAGVGAGMAGSLESGLDAAVRDAADDGGARMLVTSATAEEVGPSARTAFGGIPLLVEDVDGGVVVRPDPARVGTGDLAGLVAGAERLPDALVDDGVASRTSVSGGLGAWAAELDELAWRSRLLAVVPFLLVAVGGVVAARDVVRVLALSRITELAVTRSRGASRRRILAGELREVVVAGLLGAVGGGAVASLVAGTPPLLAVAVTVLVPVALAAVAVPVVLGAIPRDRSDEAAAASGRGRAAGVIGLVLLFAGTALALWRLVSTGSAADPLGIAAPALGVLAGSVLVLAAVGGAARLVDVAAARWRGLGPALAVRRLARRLPVLATVVLLVAIAGASTVFAATFAATGERVARDVRELRAGGDLLVTGFPTGQDAATLPADALTALLASPGQLGSDEPVILAAASSRLAEILRPVPGLVDPGALAAAIEAPATGLLLPPGTTRLEFAVVATDGVALTAWVADPAGRVRAVPLDRPVEGPVAALLAIDADVSRGGTVVSVRIPTVTATTASGSAVLALPTDWQPQWDAYPDLFDRDLALGDDALGFDVTRRARDDVHVRLMPPSDPFVDVPAVLTTAFATRNGLDVGDPVSVRFAGTGRVVLAEVAAVTPALPTAGDADALLVDLPAFTDQQLRTEESLAPATSLLVRTDDPDAVRAALPAGAVATGTEPGTTDRMLGIARSLLWLAAAGAAAVALVGTAGVSASLVAERRRETRILAVLGELPSRQAAGQRVELGLTIALALVGGAAAGVGLGVVAVPSFARAAAPGSSVLGDVPLGADLVAAGILVAVLVVGLGILLAVHGGRVARDASRGSTS